MINLNTPTQTHKYMSHVLTLEAKRPAVRKKPLSHSIQVGANTLLFLVITLSMIVTFLYLAHANSNATQGYAIKELQAERSELLIETEVAEMTISDITSLKALEADPVIKTMVAAADNVQFIGQETTLAYLEE